MPTPQEAIKTGIGNPFAVREKIEAAAKEGFTSLTEDDKFLAKWYGLYTHRNEPGYFMLRLKIPGGFLSSAQMKTIAKIAAEQNKDFADLTTRQDIQLHWVAVKEAPWILETLKEAGISTLGACGDVMRNIVGCPVAGVDAREYFDASPVLQEASDFFLGNVEFGNLPRKYKVSIAACRDQCQQPEIQCVSFVGAERRVDGGAQLGFDVQVGGGLSTKWYFGQRMNAFVRPEQVVPVLKAITEVYRDALEYRNSRSRARFKYLVADWGIDKLKQAVQAKLDFPLEEMGPYEEPADSYKDHVGVHEQKQPDLFYVGIPVPVGRITGKQMRKAADLAQTYGDGTIRLTVRQNLLLLNIPKDKVAPVLEGLDSVGLNVNGSPILRGVLACTGIEFCRLAVTETKARALEIVEYLEGRVLLEEPLRIHVTGCPNTCAQSPIAHIGLQGSRATVEGRSIETYDVAVGGQLGRDRAFNRFLIRKIPATEIKSRLERLLLEYKRLRKSGEAFNDFCRRIGDEAVVKLLAPPEKPSDRSW
ncbi:MAG: nitrite/sulfite reductase [Candidatus Omnitrophica bacterium]|nr:nitrite/sulfite reductase [Candidatus Omnitrophota bacterium]